MWGKKKESEDRMMDEEKRGREEGGRNEHEKETNKEAPRKDRVTG